MCKKRFYSCKFGVGSVRFEFSSKYSSVFALAAEVLQFFIRFIFSDNDEFYVCDA